MTGEGRTVLLARPSAWWLVLANLLPIAGVIWLGWSIGELLLLYWVETTVIGVIGIVKMIVVGYDPARSPWQLFLAIPSTLFFVLHFGGFSAGHLFFLTQLFDIPKPNLYLGLAVLGLGVSHGYSFLANFIGRGEFRRVDKNGLLGAPYARVVILHIVIIIGAALAEATGSSLPALLLFIGLKTVVDFGAHIAEHRKADRLKDAVQLNRLRNAGTTPRNALLLEALGRAEQARQKR